MTSHGSVHRAIAQAIQKDDPEASLTSHSGQPNVKTSSGKGYFTKIGSTSEVEQYIGEAESLEAMDLAAPGLVPKVIGSGIIDQSNAESPSDVGKPFLVTEYKDLGSLTDSAAKALGKRLATELHAHKGMKGFGFHVPTFCGRTRQANGHYTSWEECYSALIGSLLDQLKGKGRYSELCSKGELVRKR